MKTLPTAQALHGGLDYFLSFVPFFDPNLFFGYLQQTASSFLNTSEPQNPKTIFIFVDEESQAFTNVPVWRIRFRVK